MQLPNKARNYILFISIIAVLLLSFLIAMYKVANIETIVFWVVLAVITESLLIVLPNGVGVSVGFAISLAVVIFGGPLMAAVVSALGVMLRITNHSGKKHNHLFNTPFYKTLFNTSQSIIVAGISGLTYIYTGGIVSNNDFRLSIIPLIATLLVYVLSNTVVIARLFSLLTGDTFIRIWINSIKDTLLSSIAVGTIGIIIALAYISYGKFAVVLFFGPLLLARYSFKLYIDTRHVYMETIQALTKTIEAKDSYTSGHTARVGEYAVKLAKAMGLPDKRVEHIKTASLLHDIGKIGIDDSILKKPDELTDEEYNVIKQHPLIGADILKDVDFLRESIDIVKYHHERYDGKGYPEGLKGNDIPLEAAILTVADIYDAMTSDRPYRAALTVEEAIIEIEDNAGKQVHPKLAEVFIDIIKEENKKELEVNVR